MGKASVFYVDDLRDATRLFSNNPTQEMQEYFHNSVQSYVRAAKDISPTFTKLISDRYNQLTNSQTIQHLKNLKNRIASLWEPNSIRSLLTINDIQQAPDIMKRWVMAEPNLREMYQLGGISAYDNSYVDKYPNTLEKQHYDYRRVTDGVSMMIDDHAEYTIYQEYVEDDDILSIAQKCSILSTWDIIQSHLASDDMSDPTSVWNGTR